MAQVAGMTTTNIECSPPEALHLDQDNRQLVQLVASLPESADQASQGQSAPDSAEVPTAAAQ